MKRITAIVIFLALGACGAKSTDIADSFREQNRSESDVYHPRRVYSVGGINVREFKLDDGTRCVLAYQGGITCAWKDHE